MGANFNSRFQGTSSLRVRIRTFLSLLSNLQLCPFPPVPFSPRPDRPQLRQHHQRGRGRPNHPEVAKLPLVLPEQRQVRHGNEEVGEN